MFDNNRDKREFQQDFKLTFLKREGSNVYMALGPKFLPMVIGNSLRGDSWVYNNKDNAVDNEEREQPGFTRGGNIDSVTSLPSFYAPENVGEAILLHASLKDLGKGADISRYCPARDVGGDLEFGYGEFVIPHKTTTIFWLHVPYGAGCVGDPGRKPTIYSTEKEIRENYISIGYGSEVPPRTSFKYNTQGHIQYTMFIPFLSITPDDLSFEIEDYGLGQICYFSDKFVQSEKERPFWFDRMSSYFS